MKQLYPKLLRCCAIGLALLFTHVSTAQFVTIPDSHFVTWLNANGFSGCMSGNTIDTACDLVINTRGLYCLNAYIQNLSGVQYFKNLDTLICSGNEINSIPALPASLQYLDCSTNELTSLPQLPQLLTLIYCNRNSLTGLPALPAHLQVLDCSENSITSIPTLPTSLQQLICQSDSLTSLPALVSTQLTYLNCSGNNIDSLPVLPPTLQTLLCIQNNLHALQALPASLTTLYCGTNAISIFPALPPHLQLLDCSSNNLSQLPDLPGTLTSLACSQNVLTSLPELPDSLYLLNCYFNQYLTCLPRLKRIVTLQFFNCPVTCLPNYGSVTSSTPLLSTLPLCGIFSASGCGSYADISGEAYFDANRDCAFDDTDQPLAGIKMQLFDNGNLLQQTYTTANGDFGFAAPAGNYVVKADTTGLPFKDVCQHTGSINDTLGGVDSIYFANNFAFECWPNGFDAGITSIINNNVNAAPGAVITVNTIAGDISALFNQHCAAGNNAEVVLTFSGPVAYAGPAPGALTPSSSNSSSVTWNIADLGTINNYRPFSIMLQVNNNALAGAPICIMASITTGPADYNPSNNTLYYCFAVEPAASATRKEVYPAGLIDTASQWLTYTVRFSNTGSDTVPNVLIKDTLDPNLNYATFELLNTSTKVITQLTGSAITFSMPNINLPPQSVNDSASSGFIQYRVKTLSGLVPGTVINNTAWVSYNLTQAVNTNTVTDTVSAVIIGINNVADNAPNISLFPNPTCNVLNVETGQTTTNQIFKIYTVDGRLVYEQQLKQKLTTVPVSNLAAGVYVAETGTGTVTQKIRWVKM